MAGLSELIGPSKKAFAAALAFGVTIGDSFKSGSVRVTRSTGSRGTTALDLASTLSAGGPDASSVVEFWLDSSDALSSSITYFLTAAH